MKEKKSTNLWKALKAIGIAFGVAYLAMGIFRFIGKDYIGFGEDALFGIALGIIFYLLPSVAPEEKEEKHDEGF